MDKNSKLMNLNHNLARISLVTNIPTPYRDDQFDLIKRFYPLLTVYFTGDGRENRLWRTRDNSYYKFLKKIISFGKYGQLNFGLFQVVRNSDVIIIGGYEQPTYIVLLLLSKIFNIPTILMFDGVAPSRISSSKVGFKHVIKNTIIHMYTVIWANGAVSYDYFTNRFGVKPSIIFNQYLSLDSSFFDINISKKEEIRRAFRNDLDIDQNSRVILCSGRFVERKRIPDLINALGIIKANDCSLNFELVLIGDNNQHLSEFYKQMASSKSINIHLLGFVEQNQMYRYFFGSDLLVLPSIDEPWGLVLNEAVYSMIPIVASSDVGAALDLIEPGINGYIFKCMDPLDLSKNILRALQLDLDIVRSKSTHLKKFWNVESSVKNLRLALETIGL